MLLQGSNSASPNAGLWKMCKFEMATKIAFVLVSKGLNTHDSIVLKGSDKAIVSEFGDLFKGLTVVVNGLNNVVRAYKTSMRGISYNTISVVSGAVYKESDASYGGYSCSKLAQDCQIRCYDLLKAVRNIR